MIKWFKKTANPGESSKKDEGQNQELSDLKEPSDQKEPSDPKEPSDQKEPSSEKEKSSEKKSGSEKESSKKESSDKDKDKEPSKSEEGSEKSEDKDLEKNSEENDRERSSDIIRLEGDGPEYTFDEVIDKSGYGWFQTRLTLLAGMGWFADAFEIIILSLLGDYLACQWTMQQWEIAFLTSTVFIGMMFGAPFFGIIADKYGRRMTLAISLFFLFLFGACSAASNNYVTLVVLRAIMGFALGGIAQGVTLCSEYYPAKHRGQAGFYLSYFWAIGTELLLLIAWLIMEHEEQSVGWKYLLVAASIPALIVFILIKWYPESVRFYLVTHQHEKAVEQLNVLVKMNGAEIEPGTLGRSGNEEKKGSIRGLLAPPHTLTTLLFWYIWFAVAYHYYGVVLVTPIILKHGKAVLGPAELAKMFNATSASEYFTAQVPCTKFTHTNYIELAISSVAEVPGLLAFTFAVRYMERKTLMGLSCFLNTVLVLLMLVDFGESAWPVQVLLFIARANVCGLFQLVFIMTSEIFPTTLRAVGMGSGSAFARLGGAVVPFATQGLMLNIPQAALGLMSGVIALCALAAIFLPHEMKDRHMKDFTKQYGGSKEDVQP